MTEVLMFRRRSRKAGVFRYAPLHIEIRHRAIDTPAFLAAREAAGEKAATVESATEALEALGIDVAAVTTHFGQAGLMNFFFNAELLIGTLETATIRKGKKEVSGGMPAASIYAALIASPGFFIAWEQHAQRHIASASEGNAFALSPATSGTGAESTAEAAIH